MLLSAHLGKDISRHCACCYLGLSKATIKYICPRLPQLLANAYYESPRKALIIVCTGKALVTIIVVQGPAVSVGTPIIYLIGPKFTQLPQTTGMCFFMPD